MIVLKNVSKTYGKTRVLTDVSFRVEPGEFVCIIGPSGAGKTTLISLLIGAEQPTHGSVEIDGVDLKVVPPPAMQMFRRRIGVVFQDYKLLKNRTVAENVAFPLEVCGVPDPVIRRRVPELLKRMEIDGRAKAFPPELSGGEKTRTAIARAIVHSPLILLADEPTGNLDPHQSMEIIKLLKTIHAEGATVILATHDADLVDTLQMRVIRLEEGKVIRDSFGGYEHSKRHQPPEPLNMKHKIFKDAEGVPTRLSQKKVKITPIGS